MTSVGFKSPFFKALILSAAMLVTAGSSLTFAQKFKPKAQEDWITYRNERFGFKLYYPSAIYSVKADGETGKAGNGASDDEEQDVENAAVKAEPGNVNAGTIVVGPAKKEPAKDVTAVKQDDAPEVTGSISGETEAASYKPESVADNNEEEEETEAVEAEPEASDEKEELAEADSDEDQKEAGSSLTLLSNDGKSKIVVFGALNEDRISPRQYKKILLDEFGGYDKLDYQPVGKTWFVLSGYRGDSIYYQKVMFSCRNRVVNVFSINFPTADKPRYERLVEIMEDHFRTGRGTDTPSGC